MAVRTKGVNSGTAGGTVPGTQEADHIQKEAHALIIHRQVCDAGHSPPGIMWLLVVSLGQERHCWFSPCSETERGPDGVVG